VHTDISHLHARYSLMLMQYAQFLDHDISFTPVHRGFFVSIPDCRDCDSARLVHPECMPIPVPPGDPYYPPLNTTNRQSKCFSFMRSLPGQLNIGSKYMPKFQEIIFNVFCLWQDLVSR
jgi:peroxidase